MDCCFKVSFLENVLSKISERIMKYKTPIVSASVTAILAYIFMFTNKIVNWDELHHLFGKGYTITSGRWALEILSHITPNFSMPWLWGIVSCLLLIISICIIIDIFKIENCILQGILAAVVIVFPSEIGTFFFMFTSTSYAMAFLLAVLSVWAYLKNDKLHKIIGIACAVFSMGIYQAYISVTISFFVLLLSKDLLSGQKNWVAVIKDGIKQIIYLLIIGCLYFGITTIVLEATGSELNAWAERATFGSQGIGYRVIRAWKLFVAMIVFGDFGVGTTTLAQIIHIVLFALTGIISILAMIKSKKALNFLVYTLLVAVGLPLSVNSLIILLGEESTHGLTVYSFISVYIFAIIVIETLKTEKIRNILKDVITLLICIIIFSNIYIANKVYLKQYMVYENTFSFYQSIVTQIKQTPGFNETSKLIVIGSVAKDSSYLKNFGEDKICGLCGFKSEGVSDEFIKYYMGFDIPFATEEEKNKFIKENDIDKMVSYPYYGYVQKIDDYIVVKLG